MLACLVRGFSASACHVAARAERANRRRSARWRAARRRRRRAKAKGSARPSLWWGGESGDRHRSTFVVTAGAAGPQCAASFRSAGRAQRAGPTVERAFAGTRLLERANEDDMAQRSNGNNQERIERDVAELAHARRIRLKLHLCGMDLARPGASSTSGSIYSGDSGREGDHVANATHSRRT
jgi:hypothetical protein